MKQIFEQYGSVIISIVCGLLGSGMLFSVYLILCRLFQSASGLLV